jgi:RND family efflux transporter MFP subunit
MAETPGSHTPGILRRANLAVAAIAVVLLLGAAAVVVVRGFQAHALAAATVVRARQYVSVVLPAVDGDAPPLGLPGTLQGQIESTVYARTSGYVVNWRKDIGSQVRKGELLADIDAPEVDQALSQAVAAREQAESSLGLAKSSAERWASLRQKDAVTQQEFDERQSAYRQAVANLAAADANVARLRQMKEFSHVVAPFNGVITHRNVNVGDLVDAGNGGAGRALFAVAQVDPLRLYVYVPQSAAPRIKIGDEVTMSMNERPGEVFKGKIERTARAIDTATRTMQVEISIPNHDGALLPGSYVRVDLPIGGPGRALMVPTNVLLFRSVGPRVAVVDDAGRVHLETVKLGVDFGDRVEVLGGLQPTDRMILNPPDSLADGDIVTTVPPSRARM